jgi:hypothetical protein
MKHHRKIDTRRKTWKMFGGHNGSWEYPSRKRKLVKKLSIKVQRQFWNEYARKFIDTGEEPEVSWRRMRMLRSELDWWDWYY